MLNRFSVHDHLDSFITPESLFLAFHLEFRLASEHNGIPVELPTNYVEILEKL